MLKYPATLLFTAISFLSSQAQTTAKEWYDKGISLKKDESYKEAINAFKKATELQVNYADALHQLGWCYNEQELFSDAVDALLKEYNAGPNDQAANCFELGYAYEELADYDKAMTNINKAIDIDNKYASAYKVRGNINFKLKKYDKVLQDFSKYEEFADDDDKDDADYYYTKGWVQNDQKNYTDAVKSLKDAVEIDKRFADAFTELAFAEFKLGLNDDAIQHYRVAIALKPEDYHPVLGIADVYYDNIKNFDSAIVYYQSGTVLNPKKETALYRLGWCYNDRKRYADAIPPLEAALALNPGYQDAKKELGYAYYKQKRLDDALSIFEPMISSYSSDELSRYYAGFCYYLKHDQESLKRMISDLKALNSTRYVETLTKYVK